MNEIRKADRGIDDADVARDIVERHRSQFPSFITDFAIKLGYSDGDPALFVLYKTANEGENWPSEEEQARADQYHRLDERVLPELIDALVTRYPYSMLVPEQNWETFPD